jgi:pimeloyl-ACP methyl ester carboxylesterase
MSAASTRTVLANGLRFTVLEQGEGPLVLLLHGFPDTARTWSHQMPRLAAAGYRVVAPYLRGYPPTEIPAAGYYDAATLACDVKGLVDALSDGPAYVVAQDWGAAITYGFLAAFPESVRRAVTMAIPHPRVRPMLIASPEQIHRSFHWWFFQLPNLPELAIRLNDFAFIDYLWTLWSPRLEDPAHVKEVKEMLAVPGALEATLSYYRAMLDPTGADPALASVRRDLERDITVPTLAIFGEEDMRADFADAQKSFFKGPYRAANIPGCGHFLHREKPDEVTDLVLDWLRRDEGVA